MAYTPQQIKRPRLRLCLLLKPHKTRTLLRMLETCHHVTDDDFLAGDRAGFLGNQHRLAILILIASLEGSPSFGVMGENVAEDAGFFPRTEESHAHLPERIILLSTVERDKLSPMLPLIKQAEVGLLQAVVAVEVLHLRT